MSEPSRIAELEACCRELWGVMNLAAMVIDDPKVKAAFAKADKLCRKTGLLPKVGMAFVYDETK